jgi:uncharacterized protein (UPF0335 family)
MRPIVSAINSPTYNLSKWLSKEFAQLQFHSDSNLKNTHDFISKIQNITLKRSEILVSFDVESLFPSVPIPETMNFLKQWLTSKGLPDDIIKEYINLTNLVMNQNYFIYNQTCYKQEFGTTMGNSLSPFLANVFMTFFEEQCRENFSYFPRVWFRYVDDIFAVFDLDACPIEHFLTLLNDQYPSINFTYEIEKKRSLPFLDIEILRNKNNKISFSIYRKPTHTNNYIHSNSFDHNSHKHAAFHSLIHRLLSVPMNNKNFQKELEYIKHTAASNGYSEKLIEKILKKQKNKKRIQDSTTLIPTKEEKYVKLPFDPKSTKGLEGIFRKHNIKPSYISNNKLKFLLGNPKDPIGPLQNSGIYKVTCPQCNSAYIGQTRRNLNTRFKEHAACFRLGHFHKSSVAQHMASNAHAITIDNISLIKHAPDHLLDFYESIYIQKYKNNMMNSDHGPVTSCLISSISNINK